VGDDALMLFLVKAPSPPEPGPPWQPGEWDPSAKAPPLPPAALTAPKLNCN